MDTVTIILLVLVAAFALGNLLLYFARPKVQSSPEQIRAIASQETVPQIQALQEKLNLLNKRLSKIESLISFAGKASRKPSKKKAR